MILWPCSSFFLNPLDICILVTIYPKPRKFVYHVVATSFSSKASLAQDELLIFIFSAITVYHQGFDAVHFDTISLTFETDAMTMRDCPFDSWINNEEFVSITCPKI